MTPSGERDASARTRPALVATAASLGLAGVKGAAFLATGSVALLGSAIDSAADCLISAGNLLAIRAASRPPDAEHPFGHGKIEHLASLFQSLLIAAGAVILAIDTVERLGAPRSLESPTLGIAVAVVAIVASWLIARHLAQAAHREDSPALDADSKHYATDYLINGGVLVAFVADLALDLPIVDPIVSTLVVAMLFRLAWSLFHDAADALIDRSLSAEELKAVHDAVATFAPEVHGYHDLMARRSGPDRFVEMHVEIDARLSFRAAHDLVERIRLAVKDAIPRTRVTIHADPWPEDPADEQTHREHAGQATLKAPEDD